jgi:type II secretory pathway pseudopilin PulG
MKGRQSGYGLSELLVVVAISGLVISVGVPLVLSYHHNAQNTTGAQHIRTVLNQARQIAIDQKTFVRVQVPTPTQMSFYVNSTCTGDPWVGSLGRHHHRRGGQDHAPARVLRECLDEPRVRLSGARAPGGNLHRDDRHDRLDPDPVRGDLRANHDSVSAVARHRATVLICARGLAPTHAR